MTTLGAPLLMFTLVAVVTVALLIRRHWLEAFVLGAGMIMTFGSVQLGKHLLDRERPPGALVDAPVPHTLQATPPTPSLGLCWQLSQCA